MENHNKRVSLVTGGNRGIGFEIVRKLAAQGIAQIIGARNQEQALKAQEQLKRDGHDVLCLFVIATEFI